MDWTGYTPIFVRSDGDDSDGSTAAKGFLLPQSAFDAAIAAGTGNFVLDIGVGTFAGITLTTAWPVRIGIRGASSATSIIGDITGNGAAGANGDYEGSPGLVGGDGAAVEIVSDRTVKLGDIYVNAGTGGQGAYGGSQAGARAGAAGSIDLTGCVTTGLYAAGATGGFGEAGYGTSTAGGAITIDDCAVSSINCSGATGAATYSSTGETGKNGGPISILNSTITNAATSNGGAGGAGGPSGNGGSGGIGGTVFCTDSTIGGIYSAGGAGSAPSGTAGTGGAVFISNSSMALVSVDGGSGESRYQYPANGGSAGSVDLSAGSVVTSISALGGAGGNDQDSSYTSQGGSGGYGGTVSITSSQATNIFISGGSGGSGIVNGSNGGAGSITSTSNTFTAFPSWTATFGSTNTFILGATTIKAALPIGSSKLVMPFADILGGNLS